MKKKILTLSVAEPWFSKIASGTKTEEYRAIKLYWAQRLIDILDCGIIPFKEWNLKGDKLIFLIYMCLRLEVFSFKPFTHVLFVNGYGTNRPRIEKEIVSITIGKPKKGLCPGKWLCQKFFVIKFK